jgi:hypothetical protein
VSCLSKEKISRSSCASILPSLRKRWVMPEYLVTRKTSTLWYLVYRKLYGDLRFRSSSRSVPKRIVPYWGLTVNWRLLSMQEMWHARGLHDAYPGILRHWWSMPWDSPVF